MRAPWTLAAVALLVGCSDGPFVIGELGPPAAAYCPAGQDCDGRIELRYGLAGTGAWGDRFVAGRVERAPALLLRGEDATALRWPARTGGALVPDGAARIDGRGPFTDATRAAEGSFTSEGAVVRLSATELAIELVLQGARATRLLELGALTLDADAEGRLTLALGGPIVTTDALVERAWYHVLFVLRPSGARAYVNGAMVEGPGASAPLGDSTVRVAGSLAWLAVVPLDAGELDASAARERFARLTGVAATLAGGDPVPRPGGRSSVAFTDLMEDGARRLHLVGERWPRIACRPATAGAVCGYLAESVAHRGVPLDVGAWDVDGVVTPTRVALAEIPAARVGETATLSTVHGGDDARRVMSVWARGEGELVLSLEAVGRVRCVPSTGALEVIEGAVTPTLEEFGDGWARCALHTELAPLRPLAVTLTATALELAGPQVDTNRLTTSSLVLEDRELDVLAYAASRNVPSHGAASARLLLRGEELHDRSLLGLDGGGAPNAARVYAETRGATVVFAGFVEGAIAWNAHALESVLDRVARVEASWGADEARISVEGTSAASQVRAPLPGIESLTVGDAHGSGALNGLLLELTVAPR